MSGGTPGSIPEGDLTTLEGQFRQTVFDETKETNIEPKMNRVKNTFKSMQAPRPGASNRFYNRLKNIIKNRISYIVKGITPATPRRSRPGTPATLSRAKIGELKTEKAELEQILNDAAAKEAAAAAATPPPAPAIYVCDYKLHKLA